MKVLSSARIIIGAHGAGLSNIVFSKKLSALIEICGPKAVNYSFISLCNPLNVDYFLVKSEYKLNNISGILVESRRNLFLSQNKIELIKSLTLESLKN